MREPPRIAVSVIRAAPERVFRAEFVLPDGATVADAIERSGIREALPDVEIRADRIGIFARKVALDTRLRDGDRIEIYRELKVDPKDARRKRAEQAAGVEGRSVRE